MVNPFEETLQAGTIDPREQYIMQQSMFNQPEEPTYSIGDSYQGDQSGIMNWALTPAKWFHENVGRKINANEPYYNPPITSDAPTGKTTSIFKVGDTPVSVVDAFKNYRHSGEIPSFNLGSLLSSYISPMVIGATLRDHGFLGDLEEWQASVDRGDYEAALAAKGLPFNKPASSTFSMVPSRYENQLKFNVDIDDLLNKYVPGISVPGDLSASYIHDFDSEDPSDVIKLMYSLQFGGP